MPTYKPLNIPFRWEQGEHMTVIGDTGTGKSTLLSRLIVTRANYIVLQTKPDDVKWDGKLVHKNSQMDDPRIDRWILRPEYDEQSGEIHAAYERVWREGHWCLVTDELFYVQDMLRMKLQINRNMTQGRSKHITMVNGMQRPVEVTRFAISQSSHVITYRLDERDAKTVGMAAGGKEVENVINSLGSREFLWYHRPSRRYWTGRLDLNSGALVETTKVTQQK